MSILILHITIAICSIFLLSFSVIKPTKAKINSGYVLIMATLASGTYLVISTGSPLQSSCISGITYVAVATLLTAAAHKKLANRSIMT